jgi:lysophospholipase L1-like esterase
MQDGTNPALSVVAYGDSNTWGAVPQPYRGAGGRFGAERWTRVMQAALGGAVDVIEEGLNGRTTCIDDPIEGEIRNGERYLPVALLTHMPIDLVIIMLGTNDLKTRLSMTAGDIADGAGKLVDLVQRSNAGPGGKAPAVLLVAPAPLAKLTWLAEMFEGGSAKSQRFAQEYARVATAFNVPLLDAGTIIASSDDDGIHLDTMAHRALGFALAQRVQTMFGLGPSQD